MPSKILKFQISRNLAECPEDYAVIILKMKVAGIYQGAEFGSLRALENTAKRAGFEVGGPNAERFQVYTKDFNLFLGSLIVESTDWCKYIEGSIIEMDALNAVDKALSHVLNVAIDAVSAKEVFIKMGALIGERKPGTY